MARWIAVLVCLVLLTSCAPSTPTPVADSFRCRVNITYDDLNAVAVLDRTQAGVTELTFSHPQEINGFIMKCNGEELTMEYRGISLSLAEDTVPVGAVVKAIGYTLDEVLLKKSERPSSVINGECAMGEYVLRIDESTGYPLSLEMPSLALKTEFFEWETTQN